LALLIHGCSPGSLVDIGNHTITWEFVMRARWQSRWVTVGCAGIAVGLVPWAIMLSARLPSTVQAQHWGIAWGGFDLLMAVGAGSVAWFSYRRDSRAALAATATATLAVTDAWFDVMTAQPGPELYTALTLALFVELPLAVACGAIAMSAHRSPAPATHVLAA
jgi:hypothetical protein